MLFSSWLPFRHQESDSGVDKPHQPHRSSFSPRIGTLAFAATVSAGLGNGRLQPAALFTKWNQQIISRLYRQHENPAQDS